MGYHGGTLAPLFEPDLAEDAMRDMADDGADWLLREVVALTPVHEEFGGGAGRWVSANRERGRRPGTLKRSWYRVPGVIRARRGTGNVFQAWVVTDDPIAPFVEDDTRPHTIVPRRAKALRFRAWPSGQVIYAKLVRHPGTTGQHMMLRAREAAHVQFALICEPRLQRWAVEQARHAMRAPKVHIGQGLSA